MLSQGNQTTSDTFGARHHHKHNFHVPSSLLKHAKLFYSKYLVQITEFIHVDCIKYLFGSKYISDVNFSTQVMVNFDHANREVFTQTCNGGIEILYPLEDAKASAKLSHVTSKNVRSWDSLHLERSSKPECCIIILFLVDARNPLKKDC